VHGSGIAKPGVSWVVHFDAPASLEAFYQGSGRAGRDGLPCRSLLYCSQEHLQWLARVETQSSEGAARAMSAYAMGICRRKVLLDHFGEHRGPCSGVAGEQLCDVCCEGQRGSEHRIADEMVQPGTLWIRSKPANTPVLMAKPQTVLQPSAQSTPLLRLLHPETNAVSDQLTLLRPVLRKRGHVSMTITTSGDTAGAERRELTASRGTKRAFIPPWRRKES